jgi:NAD(P)-dependent dehydrogenase (short-subunit alcohol dehydrogenase family)
MPENLTSPALPLSLSACSSEEIAESVVWLCSDAASFVTGHAMTADGGYVAQ